MLTYNSALSERNLNQKDIALAASDYHKQSRYDSVAPNELAKKIIAVQIKKNKKITETIFKAVNF